MQALIVVQDVCINLLAQRGPSYPASHSAKQSTEKSPSNTANGDPNRPADYTKHRTDFRTRQGAGGSTGRTACCANQTTRLFADIFSDDASRVTAWARGIHVQILSSDERAEVEAGTLNPQQQLILRGVHRGDIGLKYFWIKFSIDLSL